MVSYITAPTNSEYLHPNTASEPSPPLPNPSRNSIKFRHKSRGLRQSLSPTATDFRLTNNLIFVFPLELLTGHLIECFLKLDIKSVYGQGVLMLSVGGHIP